MKVGYGYG